MELNIYGDVSGGYLFDQMDRTAHNTAIEYIGECLTATASINYISTLDRDENYGFFPSISFNNGFKIGVNVRAETDDLRTIATASFLFIKRK